VEDGADAGIEEGKLLDGGALTVDTLDSLALSKELLRALERRNVEKKNYLEYI
jgi:hypothetical protein